MNFALTEQQEILRKFARDFLLEKFNKKVINELEAGSGYSPEIWQEMAALGWTGLPFPEEYGGVGMDFMDMGILLEEIGKAGAISPYFSTMVLGGLPIYNSGTEEQKKEYLPRITSGEQLLSLALYDNTAKPEPDSIETKAVFKNNIWVINGTKLFVPYAHVCEQLICLCRTGNKTKSQDNLTLFIVGARNPDIKITLQKTRTGKLCEVKFTDVKVSGENILGGVNAGWAITKNILDNAVIARCCQMLGLAQKALDMTIEYTKARKQYGRPISSFQAIQHYGADMLTDIFGMRISTYRAAWMQSKGLVCHKEIAIARNWMIQACERIINLAHQMHGAIGITQDYDLHLYTGQLKAFQIELNNLNLYENVIAGEMGL